MQKIRRVVLVLKQSKDFSFADVLLIKEHIIKKWENPEALEILCVWDKAKSAYDLGVLKIIPMTNKLKGTWSRMQLYSPDMEQYKPFLYIDLDTAIIKNLESIFEQVEEKYIDKYITLEDFYQKQLLATGFVWFPKNCKKTNDVWKAFKGPTGPRMDYFIRRIVKQDLFWQDIRNDIVSFKPGNKQLKILPDLVSVVCFHGKPRIFQAEIKWVKQYVKEGFANKEPEVSVIIPYKEDRGWLKQAIDSIPKTAQLIVSQGDGNWPQNFNKVLLQVKGKFVKFLHEDDFLTENGLDDLVRAMKEQDVDFIHAKAIELDMLTGVERVYSPVIRYPTLNELKRKNVIHCPTLLYKKEVFDKLGGFDETLETQEEYEFNLRCLSAGFKIGFCDSVVAVYRRHPKQKIRMVSKEVRLKEKQRVNEKYN